MKIFYPTNKKIIETNLNQHVNTKKNNFFLLLDILKEFGFYHARMSGISIGLNDLNGIIQKKKYFLKKDKELEKLTFLWQSGLITLSDHFNQSVNSWNSINDYLKEKIEANFNTNKIFSSLSLMIISGARGNWSQIFQLSEFRGLLLDQEGKILEVPVKNNFKQGLNLLDYSVSFYSSRKGIIDTAIKTAVSGYLTRRLVFLAQDSIIRNNDCFTLNNLAITKLPNSFHFSNSLFYKSSLINDYKEYNKSLLRNVLICESGFQTCQKCYGFDPLTKNLISLGSATGIIAAQSLSEPTTQMTLKTFHTGGAASNEKKNLYSTYRSSSKINFFNKLTGSIICDSQGLFKIKFNTNQKLETISWLGIKDSINLLKNDICTIEETYIKKTYFCKSEKRKNFFSNKIFQPLYSENTGEINFKYLILKKEKTINLDDSFCNSILLEKGKIEFSKNNIIFGDFNTLDSVLKSYYLNLYLIEKKFVAINLTFLLSKQTAINNKSLNSYNNFPLNFEKYSLLHYYDTFTVTTLTTNKFKNTIKILQKEETLPSILLEKENSQIYHKKTLKIPSQTFIGQEPGTFLTKKCLLGFFSLTDQRDEDIVNAITKINLILLTENSITHYNIFESSLKLTKKLEKIDFINDNLLKKKVKIRSLLNLVFRYNKKKYGSIKGLQISLIKHSLIIGNSFASIYSSHDVNILFRHINIILKKLIFFSKLIIPKNNSYIEKINYIQKLNNIFNSQKYFFPKKLLFFYIFEKKLKTKTFYTIFQLKWFRLKNAYNFYTNINFIKKLHKKLFSLKTIKILKKYLNSVLFFRPKFLSERIIVNKTNQFLGRSAFNEGKNVLTQAAIYGKTSWFGSLRENVIIGSVANAGSSIYQLKDSFNLHYYFKNKKF